MHRPTRILFVCTGNAARSVMASALLGRYAPEITVCSAGTHVVEGMPAGRHVRQALREIGVPVVTHRSTQLRDEALAEVDVVVGLAREHVQFVRRHAPRRARRTATLRRLSRDLPPSTAPLGERVSMLALETVPLEPWEDVADPAGADLDTYRACAREIDTLVARLVPALRGTATLF